MGVVDLLAKEGKYHKSCRLDFMHETENAESHCGTSRGFHKKASFKELCNFVQLKVIKNKNAVLMSSLLYKYKLWYMSIGGDPQDTDTYTAQSLMKKLKEYLMIRSVSVLLIVEGEIMCTVHR